MWSNHNQSHKADAGKPSVFYMLEYFPNALTELARVVDAGGQKYGYHTYYRVDADRYKNAAGRHIIQYAGGEKVDAETGLSHLAHAVFNLLAVLEKEISNTK